VMEGAIGAAVVGILLDGAAGGPWGLVTFLSVVVFLGVRVAASPFDARSTLGFTILSALATFAMGFGAVLLLRYVAPEGAAPGWGLLGRVLVEALLTGLAAPPIRWVLDRLLVTAQREPAGVLR